MEIKLRNFYTILDGVLSEVGYTEIPVGNIYLHVGTTPRVPSNLWYEFYQKSGPNKSEWLGNSDDLNLGKPKQLVKELLKLEKENYFNNEF